MDDLIALNHTGNCYGCIHPFLVYSYIHRFQMSYLPYALLASTNTVTTGDTELQTEGLGVIRLADACGHLFCRKE